jgi:hypothetical protein
MRMDPVTVGLHRSLTPWAPEVQYVFRTLLTSAGFPHRFTWFGAGSAGENMDIRYGPAGTGAREAVFVPAAGRSFRSALQADPDRFLSVDGLTWLDFGGQQGGYEVESGRLHLANDIVLSSFWLLTGAAEARLPRDRRDNLRVAGTPFQRHRLALSPLVSQYAELLGRHLEQRVRPRVKRPWVSAGGEPAFAISHDVDYPEMILWVEALRLFAAGGPNRFRKLRTAIVDQRRFWRFADWVEFERTLGTRSSFYFMARRGSLPQHLLGTPDAFYDISQPKFRRLFEYLRAEGCEIGLHASYHAHRDGAALARERERLEELSGGRVDGNRHHYWHLDPDAPNDTLLLHERAGLRYDSSLAFEFLPGFRRGICHPFRPFHPGERRAIDTVQLPPAWMDDHFDRRQAAAGIDDAVGCANGLVKAAAETGGVVVVDYHVRGMNSDFFPRYGPWLRELLERRLETPVWFRTPQQIVKAFLEYEQQLTAMNDQTVSSQRSGAGDRPPLQIERMTVNDIPAVATLHMNLFGAEELHRTSLVRLGRRFLEQTFYRANLDNPHFCCLVARLRGATVGFSAFSYDHRRVFKHTLRRHPLRLLTAVLQLVASKPLAAGPLLINAGLVGGAANDRGSDVPGWWIVGGVEPFCRSADFKASVGVHVGEALVDRMEGLMSQHGCPAWFGLVHPDNAAIVRFLEKRGAQRDGTVRVQGLEMRRFVKRVASPALRGAETTS